MGSLQRWPFGRPRELPFVSINLNPPLQPLVKGQREWKRRWFRQRNGAGFVMRKGLRLVWFFLHLVLSVTSANGAWMFISFNHDICFDCNKCMLDYLVFSLVYIWYWIFCLLRTMILVSVYDLNSDNDLVRPCACILNESNGYCATYSPVVPLSSQYFGRGITAKAWYAGEKQLQIKPWLSTSFQVWTCYWKKSSFKAVDKLMLIGGCIVEA